MVVSKIVPSSSLPVKLILTRSPCFTFAIECSFLCDGVCFRHMVRGMAPASPQKKQELAETDISQVKQVASKA
jgi:hypothetical protein